jgi:putative ABC transport system permease protein
VGVVFGLLLSGVAGVIIRTAFSVNFVSVVSPVLILGTLLFSFLIGAIAGLLPARRAAKLPPVDALRYE